MAFQKGAIERAAEARPEISRGLHPVKAQGKGDQVPPELYIKTLPVGYVDYTDSEMGAHREEKPELLAACLHKSLALDSAKVERHFESHARSKLDHVFWIALSQRVVFQA